MPLPRRPKIINTLVYIDGQDEPIKMIVDASHAPGGTVADNRHDRMEAARRKKEARLRREQREAEAIAVAKVKSKARRDRKRDRKRNTEG